MSESHSVGVRILRAGFFTTIQDLGRWGFQRWGVPVAGAMDAFALRCANRLVGNADTAAVLEITVTGPELTFEGPAVIALSGGEFEASVRGSAVPGWTAVAVEAGDTLTMGERRTGARAYLAITGGVDVPAPFGSRATHVRSGTGGLAGRVLQRGDTLRVGQPFPGPRPPIGRCLPLAVRPAYSASPTLRMVPGPQADVLAPETLEVLTQGRYLVTPESDRMGYRLSGPALAHTGPADIVSDATPLGALQVPANRQPILLMADRQATGGYPKPVVVIAADLPLAAQVLPGDTLSFQLIAFAEARRLLVEQRRRLDAALPPIGS